MCIISTIEKDKRRYVMISGVFSLERVADDYDVIKITNSSGVQHLLDPDIICPDFVISSSPEDITLLRSSKERIYIVDGDRSARIELARELASDLNVLDNEKYYRYFEEDATRTKKLLTRWYISRRGGFDIQVAIAKVENEFDSQYLALLADPGIAQHFDAFFEFASNAKKMDNRLPSPVELRRRFSEQLGTKTIYRGMMLTDEELALVQKSGISSLALTNKERASHIIQETLDPTERQSLAMYARDPISEIMARLTDFYDRENSMMISVSAYEPVARSVGYHSSKQLENPAKRMYVFECEVPIISCIKMENVFDYEGKRNTILTIGNFEINERELEVEMFIPYIIPPSAIKETKRIDVLPPKWIRHQR